MVLCGSAISVRSDLLPGTRALRGRAALELRVKPFDFREARSFWRIDKLRAAFEHNALIGGTPGYRDLVVDPSVPEDPVMRLHHLVIEPHLADLEAGRSRQVFDEVGHTVDSKILGPHFEALATEWTTRHARDEAGLDVGVTGQATVACPEHRTSHEIDVLALGRGARPRTPGTPVAFLGEAKARDHAPGPAQLRRLEHLRDLLTAAGHDAGRAVLGVFSTTAFGRQLRAAERAGHGRVLHAGLDRLYR